MEKIYIGVQEDIIEGKTVWGISLGNPNPDLDHYFKTSSSQEAYELRNKLLDYLEETGHYSYPKND